MHDYKHNVNLTGTGKITNMHFHRKFIRGEVPRITKLRSLILLYKSFLAYAF